MKFTCDRSVLLKEISIANEIIASKNAISILSNIYMEAKEGNLIIKATDMKVNFETIVPVDVITPGSVTVYGDKFYGIINSIPDGEIEFEHIDNKINIKTQVKKARIQLKSIAYEKFPEFTTSLQDFFEVPIKDFKEMVQQTIFAISDDETRYFMNGVFFEKADDNFIMVATDGRRLAYIKKPADSAVKDIPGIIIPPKILNVIIKRAGDEGMVKISVTEKFVFIQFGSYKLSSILIEGQFPNYVRVIPENQIYSFSINRLETLEALKRVSLLVEQKSYRIYLNLSPGIMTISSNKEDQSEEGDIGDAREEIPCKYNGENVSIAINYRYVEEPFKILNCDEVSIHFTEAAKAITIKPIPEQDFFHIVMPMQLD